jgi:KUP system potassium uptake protein
LYGIDFLLHHGMIGLYTLGAVFLAVTGAEALYADLGHFGRAPIRRGWCVVFPALVLNYAGQAAIVLAGKPAEGSVFFRLCPAPLLLLPLVILATLATAVASQAVITGTFSMTRQAIQLGWLPRLRIVQTSAAGYGQIYVPAVNWLLMTGTLALAIGFGSSDSLAAALELRCRRQCWQPPCSCPLPCARFGIVHCGRRSQSAVFLASLREPSCAPTC